MPLAIPVLSIIGKSAAVKTTLLEKLIPELKRLGLRFATIRHHAHPGFVIDQPGRDTWRHAQAGSELDLAYLAGSGLSEDGTPELFAAFDDPALSPELKESLGLVLSCRAARFEQNGPDSAFWASWHASRAAAGRLYLSRAEDLAEYPLQSFTEGKGFLVEGSPFICAYTETMP